MTDVVTCSVCGKTHTLAATEFMCRMPDAIYNLSEQDRTARCYISTSVCTLDHERFFLRGLLPLPVSGRSRAYNLGVWAEISLARYRRVYERWSDPAQSDEPRFSGTLANRLPLNNQDTFGLQLSIQLTGPKTHPDFFLDTSVHPLYYEQTQGIDEHRAVEYSDLNSHGTAV
jgi:hypothetical protein